jgi:hypothetical protein
VWSLAVAATVVSVSALGCGADEVDRYPDPTTVTTTGGAGTGGSAGAGGTSTGGTAGMGGTPDVPLAGDSCTNAAEIPAEGTSRELSGVYSAGAWFSFTVTEAGCYRMHTDTLLHNDYHRVYEGLSCDPLGPEVVYSGDSWGPGVSEAYLDLGSYLMHMLGSFGDPSGGFTLLSSAPGNACHDAYDVSAVSFPFQLDGTFLCEASASSSASDSAYNAVWFSYVPSTSAAHTITVVNHSPDCEVASCDVSLAVFEGAQCDPLGTEVAYETVWDADTVSATVQLEQGVTYRILHHVSSHYDVTVDPEITITF